MSVSCVGDAVPWQCEEGSHEEVAPLAEGGDHGRNWLAAAVAQGQRRQRRVLRYAARACAKRSSLQLRRYAIKDAVVAAPTS